MTEILEISFFENKKKNFTFIFQKSGDIAIQSEKKFFFKSDGPTLGTLQRTVFHTIFPGKVFCVKRPQLPETAKIGAITPIS